MTLREFLNIWNKLNIEYTDCYRNPIYFLDKNNKYILDANENKEIYNDADKYEILKIELSFEDQEIKVYIDKK